MTERHDAIEFAEPSYSTCSCCGGITTRLTRFVTREDNAFAVYFADFSDNHADRYVSVLVGFGDWSEDASPNERTAVALRIWTDETSYQVGVVDGGDCWKTDFLGKRLTREQALESEWLHEAFDLSDHIVECDLPVMNYLNGN